VLGWVVASRLYNDFPDLPEGLLTRMKAALASGKTLADVARALGLRQRTLFGPGRGMVALDNAPGPPERPFALQPYSLT